MGIKTASFFALILATICGNAFASAAGNIGTHDNRRYGSLEEPEYSAICHMYAGGNKSHCTCGFIDKHLVITNSHCVPKCIEKGCSAKFWNGKSYVTTDLKLIMYHKNYETLAGNDWAFFLASDANPNTKKVATSTTIGQVSRGGYGTLRIIPDHEIPTLRPIVSNMYEMHWQECKQQNSDNAISCIMRYINAEVERAGLKRLTGDGNNFKVQTCNITKNPLVLGEETYPNMVDTDCDSGGGDSGAPLFRGNTMVALNNSGPSRIFQNNDSNGANAVKTQNFYKYIDKAQSIVDERLQAASVNAGSSAGATSNTTTGSLVSSTSKPPKDNRTPSGTTSSGGTSTNTANLISSVTNRISGGANSTTSTGAPVSSGITTGTGVTSNVEPVSVVAGTTSGSDNLQLLYQQYLNSFQCD